jgi:DNA-binding PadR family transcriptional regulator
MFRFSHSGHHGRGRDCGPRGHGRHREMDVERFFHWIERLNSGERGRGAGGRSRRMFDGGELRLVLLKLIANEPRHGYDLIRAIEDMTGGAYAPSPGVVYPTITMLDEMDLIAEQASEGAKKKFAATPAGLAHLEERAEEVQALIERLTSIGAHRSRTDHQPVRRAMGNLRQVLQDRIGRHELDAEVLHAISDAIDEAAKKIERL